MLTLIVPGLIWTRQALADLTFDLPLPAFTTLLGRGRLRTGPRHTTATSPQLAAWRRRFRPRPAPAGAARRSRRRRSGSASTRCGCASPNAR
jgi:hypothetical protein